MKVTTIQENAGQENNSVTQLMGILQTYEMEILSDNTKRKNIAFAAEEHDFVSYPDKSSTDLVVLLIKLSSKFLKYVKQKNDSRDGKSQNQKGSSLSSSKNT